MEDIKLYDWLIVVFLHECLGPQREYQDRMRMAIEQAGAGDNVAVFLIRDEIVKNSPEGLPTFHMTVSRLKAVDGGKWTFEHTESPLLKIDNGDRRCWREAFKKIYGNYFGERNLLITFSEGAAFGFNKDDGAIARQPLQAEEMEAIIRTTDGFEFQPREYYMLDKGEMEHAERVFKGQKTPIVPFEKGGALPKTAVNDYCRKLEIIWTWELGQALKEFLPGTIDILIMCNCYMQLFDNGYNLQDKVKFLIAPEGFMEADCYDFDRMMKRITSCPEAPSETLIRGILSDLRAKYENDNKQDFIKTSSIFANRLKFYPIALQSFAPLVDELISLLEREPADTCEALKYIREMETPPVAKSLPLIDAEHWVENVCTYVHGISNINKKRFREQFSLLKQKLVVAKLAENKDCKGISIYYPQGGLPYNSPDPGFCSNFDTHLNSPYRNALHWQKFIEKYFSILGGQA